MFTFLSLVLTGVANFPYCISIRPMDGKHAEINGASLKFVGYNIPPFVVATPKPDGNYTFAGTNILLVNWLSEKLNFTASYVFLNETAIANYGSSTNLLLQLVVNKEVDSTLIGLAITPERYEKMDFTFYHWIEPYSMVVPRPGEEEKIFAFIRVFQPTVWLLILTSVFFVFSSMTLFLRIYFARDASVSNSTFLNKNKVNYTFYYACVSVMYIVSTMTNQGEPEPGRGRLSFRILVGFWLSMALIVVNSFSSTVISSLTVPKMIPPINTFEDLAASKDVGIILLADIVIGQQILEAKSGVFKTLGDQARRNPDRLFTDLGKINPLLKTGRYAFPYVQTFCKFFVVNQYMKEGKCRFMATDPLPMFISISFLIQKNSKFKSALDKALMEVWETGLTAHWAKNAVPPAPRCFAKVKSKTSAREPIRLRDASGIFLVFGIGASLSTLIFLIEIIIAKCWE